MAATPISRIGSASALGTTIPIPAGHAPGDLILIIAYRASNVPATVPAAFNTVTALTSGTNTISTAVGWRIATSSSEVSGTWTNASSLSVIVLRNTHQSSPMGASVLTTFKTVTSITYTALAASQQFSKDSWIIAGCISSVAQSAAIPAATLLTYRSGNGNSTGPLIADSNGVLASSPVGTQTQSSGSTQLFKLEIKAKQRVAVCT